MALVVFTSISAKVICYHSPLYDYAAVTPNHRKPVTPIICNVCVVRPVEKRASLDACARLALGALSREIVLVRVFLVLSFDMEQNTEVVGFPIFKEDTDQFQKLARAFHSRVERSGP